MFDDLAALFRSNARAIVLQLLFGPHRRKMYLSEMAHVSGMASRSIEIEIKHLRDLGILETSSDRSRIYYAANQNHPFFPELAALTAKAAGLDGRLRELLASGEIDHAFITDQGPELLVLIARRGTRNLSELVAEIAALDPLIAQNTLALPIDEFRNLVSHQNPTILAHIKCPKRFLVGKKESLLRTYGEDLLAALTTDTAASPDGSA
jgi:hypothetical protein